jgi:hypothetical protein
MHLANRLANRSRFGAVEVGRVHPPEWRGGQRAARGLGLKIEFQVFVFFCPVWFHPGGIANILSMVNMIARYHVTYDSRGGKHPNQFCVHKPDGSVQKFQQSKCGLYYHDTATPEKHTVLAVTTVEEN